MLARRDRVRALFAEQISVPTANVTLTVPLVVPQRWAAWSHASASADVTRISVEDVRRQLAVAVARAFLTIIARKHVVDANEHALKTARGNCAKAARLLRSTERIIGYKVRKYAIDPRRFRDRSLGAMPRPKFAPAARPDSRVQ